jgi:hypothetical protein
MRNVGHGEERFKLLFVIHITKNRRLGNAEKKVESNWHPYTRQRSRDNLIDSGVFLGTPWTSVSISVPSVLLSQNRRDTKNIFVSKKNCRTIKSSQV